MSLKPKIKGPILGVVPRGRMLAWYTQEPETDAQHQNEQGCVEPCCWHGAEVGATGRSCLMNALGLYLELREMFCT